MTSSTGPRTSARGGGAFTLLELIVVLVLISAVLAMAAPSLRGFAHGRRTADAAAKVLALTHLARSRAAAWGCIHRLNVDGDAGECWVTMQTGGTFVEIEGNQGRRFALPAGTSVTVRALDEDNPPPFLQFYPDGRCDPATIVLAGGQREVFYVACFSATERYRIATAAEVAAP